MTHPPRLSDDDKATLLRLARRTLETYLERAKLPDHDTASPALLAPGAAFVTLTRRDSGELRGCRGEIVARRPLVESVMHMAVASATDDPRFPPVGLTELPHLHIEISALSPLMPIRPEEIEVGRHGLMIVRGPQSGLLLPQVPLPYGWDRDEFLTAVCCKAGLPDDAWHDPASQLFGFECEVWEEESEPPDTA